MPADYDRLADSSEIQEFGTGALTATKLIELEFIAPPPEAGESITTMFHLRCDEPTVRDARTAGLGHVVVMLEGEGVLYPHAGPPTRSPPLNLIAPSTRPTPYEVTGGFHCVGAALTAAGWAGLTGLDAEHHVNQMFDGEAHLGPEARQVAERLRVLHREGASSEIKAAALGAWIAARVKPINPRHQAMLKRLSASFASSYHPDLDELARECGYSPRQFQRLVLRYHGATPKQYIRLLRAMRAATLLNMTTTPAETLAEVLNEFYDQSHLIREIRTFSGRTPTQFGNPDSAILSATLDPRGFDQFGPAIDPAPDGD